MRKYFLKQLNAKHGATNSVVYIFEKTAYISDCNDLSIIKDSKELKNFKIFNIDCLKFEKHPTHFNLDEVSFCTSAFKT